MTDIRLFEEGDWHGVWQILEPVFRAGETYAFPPGITEEEAHRVWVELPGATFVAVDGQCEVLGTYYLKANQPGPGSHVCNCGYAVAEHARNRGIATRMCRHSQSEALSRGFLCMQFNLVVSTNETAVKLWEREGFEKVGTLPGAYRHARMGYVDAFVMYKRLEGALS
jgi:ribosomal protein S18 acetylase RimI-like enzyme